MNHPSRNGARPRSAALAPRRPWTQAPAFRYAAAPGLVAITGAIRAGLDPGLQGQQPLGLFLAPVLILGWWAGRGPALVAALLGWFVGDYFFCYPRHTFLVGAPAAEVTASLIHLALSGALIAVTHHLRSGREQLRESETRFRSFVEATHQVIWRTNPRGEFDQPVPSWNAFTGQSAGQAAGVGWLEAIHPEDRPRARAAWDAARAAKAIYQVEYRLQHHAGGWREVLVRGVPVLEPGGRLREYIGTCHDITARKQVAEALRRSEALYRTMARNLPAGAMSVVDRDLRYLAAEGELMASLGLSKEMFEGRTVEEVFAGELGQSRAEHFRQALAGHITRNETEYQGRTIWSQFVPLRDERGEVFAAMSLVLDLTEPKQAQRALERRTFHLDLLHQAAGQLLLGQQPVDLLRQLFPQIAEAFGADAFLLYRVEPGTGRLRLRACAGLGENEQRQLERLRFGCAIGVRPAQALRQPILATHLQEREAPRSRFVRRLGFRAYLHYPLIVRDHLHGTLAFASRQRDDYDPVDLGFFQTIARSLAEALERRRLESELQGHAAELEATVEARTLELRQTIADLEGFSYSLVHDMRAPLRAMQGYAAVLEQQSGAALPSAEREFLRRISQAAGRMDQLITDALNYTRILREALPLGRVNLSELLRGMVETYPNLHPPQADLALDLGEVWVRGNQAVLTQIFSNLFGNAVKFVAPGVQPRVRVWAETDGPPQPVAQPAALAGPAPAARVRIFVQDNGIGIPKDAHETIFGMFQRLHRADQYPGTGIGLALVKKSLERTGGRISLESEPGHGSRFCVELPLAPGPTGP